MGGVIAQGRHEVAGPAFFCIAHLAEIILEHYVEVARVKFSWILHETIQRLSAALRHHQEHGATADAVNPRWFASSSTWLPRSPHQIPSRHVSRQLGRAH